MGDLTLLRFTSQVTTLGMKCTEMRRQDRPDLKREVLPELEAGRIVAVEAAIRKTQSGA